MLGGLITGLLHGVGGISVVYIPVIFSTKKSTLVLVYVMTCTPAVTVDVGMTVATDPEYPRGSTVVSLWGFVELCSA